MAIPDAVLPGTGPPGYPRRRFVQVLPMAVPDTVSSGTGSPGYPRRQFFQVLTPGSGSPGYPRRWFFQVLGPLAIPDVVSPRYWGHWLSQTLVLQGTRPPWLSQTSFLPGSGSPGYPRRWFFKILGPLTIPDVVSSRY